MIIAISGASGLIGSRLRHSFAESGHRVIPIPRQLLYGPPDPLMGLLMGTDVVIHLAGVPILGRWTEAYKKKILQSRVDTSVTLKEALQKMQLPPQLCICTSAVGIYDESKPQTEANCSLSHDFLGEVCIQWEEATAAIAESTRLVTFRLGVVLDPAGGALKRMLPAFRSGFGGPIGNGRQMMSWIHYTDLVRAFEYAISHPLKGTYNLCSPNAVSSRNFAKALAKVLKRPHFLSIPALALRLVYGKAASVLTSSQHAIPEKLLQEGYSFEFPEIHEALESLFKIPTK